MKFEVLFEDNHVLAVVKPAGLPTMGAKEGAPSLVHQAKDYIKRKYGKPGNVYLGVVSRLDSLATGVLIFARTSKAAARLTEQFRTGMVRKRYLVVVEKQPVPVELECVDWVLKSEAEHRMVCVAAGSPGAKEARLRCRVIQRLKSGTALLEVELVTGRKHQIRLQLSHRGWPVLGDSKYGARMRWADGIALHSYRLELDHPVTKARLALIAPLPLVWRNYGVSPAGCDGEA